MCKKLKIKLTKKTSKGKRVYKSIKQLKKEIKNKKKKPRFGFPDRRPDLYYQYSSQPTVANATYGYPQGYHVSQGAAGPNFVGGTHVTGPSGIHWNGSSFWGGYGTPDVRHVPASERQQMQNVYNQYQQQAWTNAQGYR